MGEREESQLTGVEYVVESADEVPRTVGEQGLIRSGVHPPLLLGARHAREGRVGADLHATASARVSARRRREEKAVLEEERRCTSGSWWVSLLAGRRMPSGSTTRSGCRGSTFPMARSA